MKKILIVMHSTNILYGAGRSLVNWAKNINVKFDILCPPSLNKKDEIEFRNQFGNNLIKIYKYNLPFERCYKGKKNISFKGKLYYLINDIFYYIERRKVKKIINSSCYDVVYLNSLVLWPLLKLNNNVVIHIREIFEGNLKVYEQIQDVLREAKAVIFIDNATFNEFKQTKDMTSFILNNPFDMRNVEKIDKKQCLIKYNIPVSKTIFAIIGMIYEGKGVKDVIQSFLDAQVDAILLIVGKIKGKYAEECISIAKSNKNIIFLGEISKIEEIYAIVDVVIRGEKQFCIGRTIYESLYSGNAALIPGSEKDKVYIDEYSKFKNKIFFYEPENWRELTDRICELENYKIDIKNSFSNCFEYVSKLKNIFEDTME